MIRSVKLIPDTGNPELEAVIPSDRVVEIDEAGRCSLSDMQFVIAPTAIEYEV